MKTVPPQSCGSEYEIAKCRRHRIANSYGMPLSYTAKCHCCGKFAQKEQLTLNFSLLKIYYCGPQLASYLTTVKYLALLLFLLCLLNALPLMLANHKGKCCEKRLDCSPSFLLSYSVFNQFDQHKKINTQCYIVLANYILCIVFSQFLRKELRKIKKQIDQTNLFPSQFAVFCKLPANVEERAVAEAVQKWWMLEMKWNKKQLKKQFPQLYAQESENRKSSISHRQSLKIVQVAAPEPPQQFIEQVIFSYNHEEYLSRLKEIQGVEQQIPIGAFKVNQSEVASKKSNWKMSRNAYCLVIFKCKQYADYFYRKNNPSIAEKLACFDRFRYVYVNHDEVEIVNELYPCEIAWKNHHVAKKEKRTLVVQTIGITFLLMACGSALMAMFSILYERYLRDRDDLMFHLYSFLIAIFINATLIVGNQVISHFCDKELHSTYLLHKGGFVSKLVLFNVCTILASPLIILKTLNTSLLWESNGFVDIEVTALLIYLVISQIARYIYPSNIKMLKRYYDFLNNKNPNLTQEAANQMCNKPPHCIQQEYASILTIIICTFFLTSFVPFITIAACIWMFLQYWLERANVSYFYKEDEFHSHHLNIKAISLLQLSFSFLLLGSLTIYVISNWYFDSKFEISLILLFGGLFAYALLSLLLPLQKINTMIFDVCKKSNPNEEGFNDNLYKTAKNSFLSFYQDFNEAYLLQKNIENASTEKRINASEELRTIEASLSHSLKERLLNQTPIITQSNEENQEYFEYEKKINMKKAHPKVSVPPLFNNASELRRAAIVLKSEAIHK